MLAKCLFPNNTVYGAPKYETDGKCGGSGLRGGSQPGFILLPCSRTLMFPRAQSDDY